MNPTLSSSISALSGGPAHLFQCRPSYHAQISNSFHRRISVRASTSVLRGSNTEMTSFGRRRIIVGGTLTYILYESSRRFPAEAMEDYILLKEEVKKVLSKAKAAGVLRLAFHDAGTFEIDGTQGGMNGSIIYELDRPENAGLKKPIKILEKAKTAMDAKRPVSWADVIAVGGAEAVSLCGGPPIPIQLGRIDSQVPDAEGKLPQETLDASSLKKCFQKKGFTTRELVALSGAHTIGGKGFGSPVTFDNSYYKILLEKPWSSPAGMSTMIGLPSDHALVEDDECLRWVSEYAEDQNLFFEDFKNAYIKLVNCGARWKMLS